jgi:membrane associated rhomboid family serine protease
MNLFEQLFASPVAGTILVITILTSLKAFQDPSLKARFIFNAHRVATQQEYYRLFTSGLIHSNGWHLGFNMLAFYFFAFPLERALLGHWQFALLYVASLGLSSLPTLWRHKDNPGYNALGASGAVSAVLLSVIMFVPDIGIGLLFLPVSIPGWLFAILYMGFSFYAGIKQWGNIGHEAHLFGAIAGIVITLLLAPEVAGHLIDWMTG